MSELASEPFNTVLRALATPSAGEVRPLTASALVGFGPKTAFDSGARG